MGKLVWFVLGVATGVAALALIKRVEHEKETEDFEEIAQSLQQRLESLEGEFGAVK